mmetsp:Transcript_18830/g.52616  ORF Transcript_18830/g.52616 Transcript_18830/m.52616 type:complete len:96 (-) Transcript_18830:128-415(-)
MKRDVTLRDVKTLHDTTREETRQKKPWPSRAGCSTAGHHPTFSNSNQTQSKRYSKDDKEEIPINIERCTNMRDCSLSLSTVAALFGFQGTVCLTE